MTHPRNHLTLTFFVIILILSLIPFAHASTNYNITNAAYAVELDPTNNFNNADLLVRNMTNNRNYIYIELPVSSGTRNLTMYEWTNAGGRNASIYNTNSFNESNLTWNNKPAVNTMCTPYHTTSNTGWYNFDVSSCGQYIVIIQHYISDSWRKYYSDEYATNISRRPYMTLFDVNYSNTNSLLVSNNTDYNNTISTTNDTQIYLTTWINNSNWAFFSPLYTYIEVTDPRGSKSTVSQIWGQNAYQISYDLNSKYWLSSAPYGNYTFDLICLLCSIQKITTTNLTYTNPTNAPSTISINNTGNNVSITYWVNPLNYGSSLNNIDYKVTYDRFYPNAQNDITLCSIGLCVLPKVWNGTTSLDSFIKDKYYFYGETVLIHAYVLHSNGSIIAHAERQYKYSYLPTPTVTQPTPIPTPTTTITPNATYQPPFNPDNYTSYNGSGGVGDLTGNMGNISGNSLGNINNGTGQISSQISAYDYSKSKSFLSYIIPSIFNMLPAKLWGIIILGISLEISLILLKR